jgi:hypothetical protein
VYSSVKYSHNSKPSFFAKTLAKAIDAPKVKFAPNFSLFFPALSIKKLSKSLEVFKI